ncbi:uncharacterized protein SCHCODRAFT_02632908 [Schizophyllum commune H4-8]|nr:uncharacterized protein SCHCODRAFT_02632908 [Schizophyllum commune H4-8]KAI5890793.1 hypothetical protein SCHCODRAFT_02632908 [Schizophyllum commune H4-8]
MAPILSPFENHGQSQRRGAHHLPRVLVDSRWPPLPNSAERYDATPAERFDTTSAERVDDLRSRSPASVELHPASYAYYSPDSRAEGMPLPPFLDSLGQPLQLTPIGIALIALVSSLTIVVVAGLCWTQSPRLRDLAHDARISIQLAARRLVKTSNSTISSSSSPPKSILKSSAPLASVTLIPSAAEPSFFSVEKPTPTPAFTRGTTIRWADLEKDISAERIINEVGPEDEVYVIRASESDHSMFYGSDSNLHSLLNQAGLQSVKRRAWADAEDTPSRSYFADSRVIVSPSTSNESSVSGTFSNASGSSSFTSIDSASTSSSDTDSIASADIYEVRRAQTRSMEVKRGVLVNWRLSSGPDLSVFAAGKDMPKQDLFAPALIVTGPSSETLSTVTTSSSLDLTDFPIPPPMISSALDGLMETIYSSEESDGAEDAAGSDRDSLSMGKADFLKRSTVDQFIMLYGEV